MSFMKLLENLYEKPPKISHFFGRKYHITSPKTLLIGMRKSGISSIIIDFLSTLKSSAYMYINLDDPRVAQEELKNLDIFVKREKISHVVIENFTKGFKLPDAQNIILSSHDKSLHVKEFDRLEVEPLSFEEFIGFQQRHFNTEHLFNLFTNSGRLPKSQVFNEYENSIYLQNVLHSTLQDEIQYKLFCYFALHQSQPISLFQAYQSLKKEIKISKDKLYKIAYELEENLLISYLPKLGLPKAKKKIYLRDFAFKSVLTYEKDFMRLFENMVFCELHVIDSNIYYTDDIHFILPNQHLAILCIPFLPPELIYRRFSRLIDTFSSLHVKSVQVVTIGNEGSYEKEEIRCEIVPFWEWALML